MKTVFTRLSDLDADVLRNLTGVVTQLEEDAGDVLELVIDGRYEEARRHVLETYRGLVPLQQTANGAMQRILRMKDELQGFAAW
jgi:hypothetical protein